jgi:hypothetical protein
VGVTGASDAVRVEVVESGDGQHGVAPCGGGRVRDEHNLALRCERVKRFRRKRDNLLQLRGDGKWAVRNGVDTLTGLQHVKVKSSRHPLEFWPCRKPTAIDPPPSPSSPGFRFYSSVDTRLPLCLAQGSRGFLSMVRARGVGGIDTSSSDLARGIRAHSAASSARIRLESGPRRAGRRAVLTSEASEQSRLFVTRSVAVGSGAEATYPRSPHRNAWHRVPRGGDPPPPG